MAIKEVTYFKVECDGCGADAFENGEFGAYADPSYAAEMASDSDWMTEVGVQRLDFCRACIPAPTDESDRCGDHIEMSKVGDRWVCDACATAFGPVAGEGKGR